MTTTLTRKATKFGLRSSHIILPKDWIGLQIEIKAIGIYQPPKEINWQNIEDLIDSKIRNLKTAVAQQPNQPKILDLSDEEEAFLEKFKSNKNDIILLNHAKQQFGPERVTDLLKHT